MSSDTTPNQTPMPGNRPSHIAYTVRKPKEGEKAFWTQCGAAWPHKDGRGMRIRLEAVPVSGVIELRVNEPAATAERIDWSNFDDCE